jgi:hypothetical protein
MCHSLRLAKLCLAALLCLLVIAATGKESPAASDYHLSRGQTLYVPVYSNIFSAPRMIPFNLATMLSIRNTDMTHSITVASADYYDTKGRLLKRFYLRPFTLAPLESTYVFIPEDDVSGGTGANFIVRWYAAREVNSPLIESVMTGMKSGQGISFTGQGREIRGNGR